MTTSAAVTGDGLAPVDEPLFSQDEQAALAGYSGLTRAASTLDLQMHIAWCVQPGLRPLAARRADIDCFGRDLETAGRAWATIARRL
jgi:integrase/recombinase XerD